MECPYCAAQIVERALICPHCTRDLYLFKPLLARIEELSARVAAHADELASIARRLDAGPATQQAVRAAPAVAAIAATGYGWAALRNVILALIVLHAGAWFALLVYGATLAQLAILTCLLSLPFGYTLMRGHRGGLGRAAGVALVLGFLAVFTWRAMHSLNDDTPLIPATLRDWREPFEFFAGMSLAHLTGAILWRTQENLSSAAGGRPPEVLLRVAALFTPRVGGPTAVDALAASLQ
jgi:hypothetical protein